MDPLQFDINPSSSVPIYKQIVDQVQRMVLGGNLETGADLPSVRTVASQHAINPMTVSKAYSQLEVMGLIQRVRGQGMIVAATTSKPKSLKQRLELLRPVIRSAATQARELDISLEDAIKEFKDQYKEESK
jgi:GntR family transcriptional regulator